MSSMFDDFKEQVRSQANIVEIVSEYVPLKKTRQQLLGLLSFSWRKNAVFFRIAG